MREVVELINRLYKGPDCALYDKSVSIWIAMQLNSFLALLHVYNPSLLGINTAKQLHLNKNNM